MENPWRDADDAALQANARAVLKGDARGINRKQNEKSMLLLKGDKIHVVHRRLFDKDIRKHFIGEVEEYEAGIVRAVGHVFVIEDTNENVFRKMPERQIRLISLNQGAVHVNIIPPTVDLDKATYESRGRDLRVTDGSEWHLDIKEFGWS